MGFSVDYQFVQGGPQSSQDYFWVIYAGGKPAGKCPVKLEGRGNLSTLVPQLRPENGPFACHLEDYSGRRLSEVLPMQ